jgi:hypothetical protein
MSFKIGERLKRTGRNSPRFIPRLMGIAFLRDPSAGLSSQIGTSVLLPPGVRHHEHHSPFRFWLPLPMLSQEKFCEWTGKQRTHNRTTLTHPVLINLVLQIFSQGNW